MTQYDLSHLTQSDDQWVIGPIQDDEALFLYALIRGMRLKTVLEIGGLNGYSARNFISAVGITGSVYTVDINYVNSQAPNHHIIIKDAVLLTADDLQNQTIELIFFDCHDYDVQMTVFNNLYKSKIINDRTVIALHDTNLHYPNSQQLFCHGPSIKRKLPILDDGDEVAYIHQDVERRMVNDFVSIGYHTLCLHTTADKHDESFPNRHGLTVLTKFEFLRYE